jgi:hypothetical protein
MALARILAEANIQLEPFLVWFLRCAGVFGVAELLAGVVVFLGACHIVVFCKQPAVIVRYLWFVQIPLLIGILGMIAHLTRAYSTDVRMGHGTTKWLWLTAGFSEGLIALEDGFLMTLPSYCVIGVGLLVRKGNSRRTSQQDDSSAMGGISNE